MEREREERKRAEREGEADEGRFVRFVICYDCCR